MGNEQTVPAIPEEVEVENEVQNLNKVLKKIEK